MSQVPPNGLLQWRDEEAAAYAAGDYARLAAALASAAGSLPDPAEKAGTFYRAGCAAMRGGDLDRALELFRQVQACPRWQRLARVNRLELHFERGQWPEFVAVLDEDLADPALWSEIPLRLEKTRVLAFRLGHMEEAQAELAAVLAQDPACREAWWLKLVLALRAGGWDTVVEIYRRLAELAAADPDPAFTQSALLRLGQVLEFRFKKPDEAMACYDQLDRDEAPLLSLYPRFEIGEAKADWPGAAQALEETLAAMAGENDPAASTLGLLLARIKEDGLNDPAAADRDYQALAARFPDDLAILATAAERAMETGEPKPRADLAGRMMAAIVDHKEKGYFAADRVRVLMEDLQSPEDAAATAQQWLAAAPEDISAGRWLIEALVRAGRDREAVAEIDRELARTADPREKQGLLLRKADIATMRLNDHAAALAAYREALAVPPSQFPILLAMSRLYHRDRDYANLARVVTAAVKLITDAKVVRFYRSWLAAIYLERLGQDNQAFMIFGELLKQDPSDLTALKTIARLAKRNQSWPNFVGALNRMSETTSDPALKAELKCRIAWASELRLARPDLALAGYRDLAAAGHPFAAESLRRLALRDADLAAYAQVLAPLAEQSAPGPFQAARYTRLASAHEVLGQLSEAWVAYEKARVSLTAQPHLLLPMIDLAQLSGYWIRYVNLIEDFASRLADANKKAFLWEAAWSRAEMPAADGQIDAAAMQRAFRALEELEEGSQAALRGAWLATAWTGDDKARADLIVHMIKHQSEEGGLTLRLRLGYLLRDNLGANEESIAAFRQVLAKDPKATPLIRELALMYEQAGQWGELIRMLLLEVPLRKEIPLLIDIYSRLAHLYEEKFKALDEAVKCTQAVLKMAPALLAAHAELARMLQTRERWEDLATALSAWHKAAPESGAKVEILIRAATVLDERIHDPNRAIDSLKSALELEPTRPETVAALSRIYAREQRWDDLIGILADQAGRVPEPAAQSALHEQIAEIQEHRLHNANAAIDELIVARGLDPGRRSVLLSLERLFTAASRWNELIDTLERLAAAAADDAAAQLQYFSRIGSLWDVNLGQLPEAIASWERARGLDAHNVPAHEALVSLYERTANGPLFVERAAALAELVAADKPRAVELLIRAAKVEEDRLKDDGAALSMYARAMQVDDQAVAPVDAARAVRERRGEWQEVVKLLGRQEAISPALPRKLDIFTRIGEIFEHQIRDVQSASGAYARALGLKADHLPAVKPQAEIFFAAKSWADARPLYEIWTAALAGEPPEPAAQVWYKAGWCAEQGQDVPAAMTRYLSSVMVLAAYRPPLERLSEQYTLQAKWNEAADFTGRLLVVVREAADNEAAFTLLSRQGFIEEKRNLLGPAAASLEQALEIKPGHYDTLIKLIGLYSRLENWKKVLTTYDLVIRNAPSTELQSRGLSGKGEVLEDRLKEEQSALAHFQKAAQIFPGNLPAWYRLAAIYFRRLAWPDAEKAYSQVIALEPDPQKKIEPHYLLGRVYAEGLSDLPSARIQFESVLEIDKLHIPAMQALGDIYLKLEEWQKFIDTTEAFVRLVPAEQQASLSPTYTKLGAVYRDHLKNTERAIINYQQVIKLDAADEKARNELAALYVSDPKFIDQAKSENLNIIRMQPFRVQSYRDLANIYKNQNNLDAQFCIYTFLKMLSSLDYEEEIFFDANSARVRRTSKRQLKEIDRVGNLLHPDERGPMRDMMVAMGPYLAKQFPMPLDKMGAKKGNALSGNTSAPVMEVTVDLVNNLGFEGNLSLYLSPAADPVVMSAGDNHHLVVNSEWFARFSAAEQRFLVGRMLEHLINFHSLAMLFPVESVTRTMSLIALAADARLNFNIPGLNAADIEKQKKAAKKLIPGKIKSNVEHIAQRFSQDTANLDPAKWRKAMEHTANRAGLLVCSDPAAAFAAIIKTDPRTKNIKYDDLGDPKTVWAGNEYVVELISFAVSDAYFRLRDRAGFAIV
jgi:cellulose synthase operon protein C